MSNLLTKRLVRLSQVGDPDAADLMCDTVVSQHIDPSFDEPLLPVWCPRSVSDSSLCEVVLLWNSAPFTPSIDDSRRKWEPLGMADRIIP